MKNISKTKNCFGCGVCSIACPKHLINIGLNSDGFYEPLLINERECVDCGICLDVCSFHHSENAMVSKPYRSYAAWSNDSIVRNRCSSGGVAFEICRDLLKIGYNICSVRFDVRKNRAEHYIADNEEELLSGIGSKYIQSYTLEAFKAIKRDNKYLIVGTPCQIDSFRRFVKKYKCGQNFIFVDFFCHGVPSKLLWDKYLLYMQEKYGEMKYVSWRNKFNGVNSISVSHFEESSRTNWHDSYNIYFMGDTSVNSKLSQGDMFYRLFLSGVCLGKACYHNCRFKYNMSSADIRIGDMWGVTYSTEEKGVSALIAFTQKGLEIAERLHCHKEVLPFSTVSEGQQKKRMKENRLYRYVIIKLLSSKFSIRTCYIVSKPFFMLNFFVNRISNPKRTLLGICKRIKAM